MATLRNTIVDDTGFVSLPFGTTAQRPASPVDGDTRFNTDRGFVEFYYKGFWVNAETNYGGIAIEGLQLFLDAANPDSYPGTGNTWFDLSGNGRNFTCNAAPNTATDSGIFHFLTNGRIARGPASNSFGVTNTSGYTIFVICRQITSLSTAAFNWYGNGYTRGIFAHLTWSDNRIYFDSGVSGSTRTEVASLGAPYLGAAGAQDWNVWTFRRFGLSNVRTISKNGAIMTLNDAAVDLGTLGAGAAEVGNTDQYPFTWDARLHSFLLYNKGLSDEEVRQTTHALRAKYRF
jgi:hypothetical protein